MHANKCVLPDLVIGLKWFQLLHGYHCKTIWQWKVDFVTFIAFKLFNLFNKIKF